MFGIYAPITYNTDLTQLYRAYFSSFYMWHSPVASLFSSALPCYEGMYAGYQYNNYYPNPFGLTYTPFGYYSGGYSGESSLSGAAKVSSFDKPATNQVKNAKASTHTKNAKEVKHTKASIPSKITNVAKNVPVPASKIAIQTPKSNFLGKEFVNVARKYSNCSESDNSHAKFCINQTCKTEDPFNQEWCTDFVTYVVKEAYRNNGKVPPAGFGNHDVNTLKNWAIQNNMFIRTSNKSQKGTFISENIKVGDIMIINENGASHTGFVTGIDKKSGVIHTIEGNRDDRVKEYSYSPNYPDLSGFIRLAS